MAKRYCVVKTGVERVGIDKILIELFQYDFSVIFILLRGSKKYFHNKYACFVINKNQFYLMA